jgi:hypothetical protein
VLRRLGLVLLVLLVPVALGGCADGKVKEANAYVGAVNDAQARFAASSERLLAQIKPDDPSHKERVALTDFYGAVDKLVSELRAIAPPAKVKALHERLIGSMVRFGARLRSAGTAITSGDASRILAGQEQLAAASAGVSRSINSTIQAINDALKG